VGDGLGSVWFACGLILYVLGRCISLNSMRFRFNFSTLSNARPRPFFFGYDFNAVLWLLFVLIVLQMDSGPHELIQDEDIRAVWKGILKVLDDLPFTDLLLLFQ
jgi:hypothetical protein